MIKPIMKAAVIHDLCGGGKAALTNIMPVMSLLEIEVCPIPTMILSYHTGGHAKPVIRKLEGYISEAFNYYNEINLAFDGIFIGYLGSSNNIKECLKYLNNRKSNNEIVVFDPICADNGKLYSNFNEEYLHDLKEIIRFSDVITPNYTEICFLSGEEVKDNITEEELLNVCRKIKKLGCKDIIITSVPLDESEYIGTCVYNGQQDTIHLIKNRKVKASFPGTGDIFTSVLFAWLLKEENLNEACEKACKFVAKCINESVKYDYDYKEGVLLEKCLKYLL